VKRLKAGNVDFVLHVHHSGWCQLELHTEDRILKLGAEMQYLIVHRLSHALDDTIEGKNVGSIQGVDVKWVLTLAEKHCSIYVGQVDSERVLFIQSEDCTLLARVNLLDSERRVLFSELDSLKE